MDVIVIGCGAAGAAALRRLHDAGLTALGLEAADRLGGRICTVDFGECALDLGAAWCHGEKDNIVFELVNPLGLLGRPDPGKGVYVLSNGDLVPDELSQSITTALGDAVAKADKDTDKSVLETLRSAAHSDVILQSNLPLTNYFIENYERQNHLGGQKDPTHGKSLRGLVEHWPCEGEPLLNWNGRGYKTILDVLLKRHPDPTKEIPVQILLNKEVQSIKWSSSSRGVDASNPLVQVRCKDGSLYAAKSVILTVSIGVLKERHAQLFNPPLPADKVIIINSLQMAVLDKIYIEFEKPWWPKGTSGFSLIWRDEDKGKFSDNDRWVTEVFGLDTVAHQPNVLLAWLYGTGAEAMETASLAAVHAGVQKLLDQVLKNKFHVTPIKKIIRSQWALNPLARGAYAYRSVATERGGGLGAVALSEPLCHGEGFPVVCFAGEATSHHRHSAVHGAVHSGFREADRLIASFKHLETK